MRNRAAAAMSFGRIPAIGAGILDVGTASAATLVCGVLAARLLDAHVLGAYALAFRVLVLAMTVPAYLIFQPREVQAMQLPEGERIRMFVPGVRIAAPIAMVTAVVSAFWPLTFPGGVSGDAIVALNATMCLVAVFSPLQDFLRRMLHMSGRSWQAATVSLIQLLVVSLGWTAVAFGVIQVPTAWIPFGLLALANAVSLIVGMVIVRSDLTPRAPSMPEASAGLLSSGGWLLFMGVMPSGTAVLAGVVLAHVSGPDALGYLEAARIVAQPIFVFAVGLTAVLGPRSMHAAQTGQAGRARQLARRFKWALATVGVVYALVFGTPHAANVLTWLTPKAFAPSGIVMLMIVAQVALNLALPERSELLGAGRSRSLAGIEAISSLAYLACAFLAVFIGIFALPIGLIAQGIIRLTLMRIQAARLYLVPLGTILPDFGGLPVARGAEWTEKSVSVSERP